MLYKPPVPLPETTPNTGLSCLSRGPASWQSYEDGSSVLDIAGNMWLLDILIEQLQQQISALSGFENGRLDCGTF